MGHVVLLGDSIFDNAIYVPGKPPVIEQLRNQLPSEWKTTLLAVDGNVTKDVLSQTSSLPEDSSHLIISCGGNKNKADHQRWVKILRKAGLPE